MTSLRRMTRKRLLMCLVAVSLLVTVLVVRSLHSQHDEALRDKVLQFQPRVVFPDQVPGEGVRVRSAAEHKRLLTGAKTLDQSQKLVYERASDASPLSDSIPRIIHQTWPTPNIPKSLVNWVKSFIDQNPDFEYWFWSDEDALNLVKTRYPEYLEYYTKYPKPIQKADVMRYFVLHEFGGFYSDMDISALKSLEPLRRHPCIVSQEPWVHAKVYWGLKTLLPCNAFLASAPKHPFMKRLIDNIPMNFRWNNVNDVMDKIGPMMLNRMLTQYKHEKANNFTDFDRIYLAEPSMFHPRFDPNLKPRYIQGCDKPEKYHLSPAEIQECRAAKARRYQFLMPKTAYTDHHWMHYWIGGNFVKKINPSNAIHINEIIPNVRNVSDILRGKFVPTTTTTTTRQPSLVKLISAKQAEFVKETSD